MYSVVQYDNGSVNIVSSKHVTKREDYCVYRYFQVKVLYDNDDEVLCKNFVENINDTERMINTEVIRGDKNCTYTYELKECSVNLEKLSLQCIEAKNNFNLELVGSKRVGQENELQLSSDEFEDRRDVSHRDPNFNPEDNSSLEPEHMSDEFEEDIDDSDRDPDYRPDDDSLLETGQMINNEVITGDKNCTYTHCELKESSVNMEKLPLQGIGVENNFNLELVGSKRVDQEKELQLSSDEYEDRRDVSDRDPNFNPDDNSSLETGCAERKKLIEILRKKGCYEYNTNENYNKGQLIVSRRPKIATDKTHNYKVCPHCKGYFSKFSIRKHYAKCIPERLKGERSVSVMGNVIHGQIHKKASEVLRTVFAHLHNDDVTKEIRYDELVIILGNTLCEKYRLQHMHRMIRAKLRLIGRFLLKVKQLDPTIKNYMDVFLPEKFDTALKAINYLGSLDPMTQQYSSPATAADMGTMLKKSAKLLITLCIKNKNNVRKLDVEDFFKILEEDLPIFVNKPVLECQLQQKRKLKVKLPNTHDVAKFNSYLEKNRQRYHQLLLNKYSYNVWKELASFCLTLIQTFNRKRAGEVERIKVEDFREYESINPTEINDLIETDQMFSSNPRKYVRFVIRGKLGRGVPVLLSNEVIESVELILKHRQKAGVPETNPYLFALPGNSTFIYRHLSACDLMRRFAKEAGINRPELMRGTKLRKHIATQSALLDIGESEVNDLANFLGHEDKIHRQHYRIPVAAREIGRISQLLEIGVGRSSLTINEGKCKGSNTSVPDGDENEPKGVIENQYGTSDMAFLEDENGPTLPTQRHEESLMNPTSPRDSWNESAGNLTECGRERCVTPREKKTERKSWGAEEIKVAGNIFADHIRLEETPSIPECIIAIKENFILKTRSPSQLKAWVFNQVNKKKTRVTKTKARWSPEEIDIIKKELHRNLNMKVLPGLKICEALRNKYDIFRDRNAASIKAWVNNYLRKQI